MTRSMDCEVMVAGTSGRPPPGSSRRYSTESEVTASMPKRAPLSDVLGRRHNYLRISLTERCNLRCKYCMPAEGVPLSPRDALLSREELSRLVRVFADAGVDKLRLTGGEPTLRSDLTDIIQNMKSIPGIRTVSMTSNGLVLTRKLPALQRAGLDAINISLDTLQAHRYERMSRRSGLTRVLAGIDLALQLQYEPVKINTVLMRGFNDDEICDFVEFTRDRHVEVRFIEFMPFSGNKWDDTALVPYREALRTVARHYPDVEPAMPRDNDTATLWRVPGYTGTIGFISSMTQHFCSTCNRLRLTADGNLKVCLFGASEVSLRDAMRAGADDKELEQMVRAALRNKKPQHAGETYERMTRHRQLRTDHRDRCYRHEESRPSHYRQQTNDTHRRIAVTSYNNTSAMALVCPDPALRMQTHTRAYSTGVRRVGGNNTSHRNDGEEEERGDALTHFDASGRASMVDVGSKPTTRRIAEAECVLHVSGRVVRLLRDARLPKGDAVSVARVAGALGAKRTADLIPLCHTLSLDAVKVHVALPSGECAGGGTLVVRCEARVTARTGVEMEALVGAAVAALTLYDMCKAVDKRMRITDLRVVRKTGGSTDWAESDHHHTPASASVPPLRDHDRSPLRPDETFVPTNFMHF